MKNLYKARRVEDLKQIAYELLRVHAGNKIFAFYGSLGAGKTTLIKEICDELKVVDVVNSPTFAIINQYFTESGKSVFHFDFYRIESITEAFDIGYEDYIYSDSYCFIEWPDKIESLIPEFAVKVYIDMDEASGDRIITF
jgi:tRNA threonylcarbamoyladenosine biosynthesis protein TsaE